MDDKYNADELRALGEKGDAFRASDGSFSHPIVDAEDLAVAIDAAGNPDDTAVRRFVAARAKALGLADQIPDGWNADGSLEDRSADVGEWLPAGPCERSFLLDDISIRADGTGRTVVAYAAVFGVPAEIKDQDGHYFETIGPNAFEKTINERSGRIGVFYNHGKTLYGTPSERFSMPLGTPEEIRADARGLLTVTRYNNNPLADEILESIRNGDIAGQSFSGKFLTSKRTRDRSGGLDQIHRSEVALREYGPTPMPAYKEAAVLGVRMEELVDTMRALTDQQRAELHTLLDQTEGAAPGTPEVIPAPVARHEGPTKDQRQRHVRALTLTAPKGP